MVRSKKGLEMRKMIAAMAVGLCVVSVQPAQAGDKLLEILKSKGILTEEQFAELQKETKKEIKTSFKDGFKMESEDKEFSLQVSGRVQGDFRYFNDNSKNDTFDIRRARLEAGGTLYKYWGYKVSVDFAGGTAKLKDGYLSFKYFPNAEIQMGQIYYPFGNENIASSKYHQFIEVSSISAALTPEYDRGISVQGHPLNGLIFYHVGILNGAGDNQSTDGNDDFDYAARVVLHPTRGSDGPFQAWIGGSYGWGQQTALSSGDIKVQPEGKSGNNYFSSNATSRGYDRERMGIEATLLYGPAMLKGEFIRTEYDFEKKADIQGGYVTASYFLTGEQRSIKICQTVRQEVKKPFDLEKGGWGAWELTARYSWFEVDDKFFQASGLYNGYTGVSSTSYANEGDAWTVGINWYMNRMTRLMANWVHSEASNDLSGGTSNIFTQDGGNKTDVEDALLMRVAIEF